MLALLLNSGEKLLNYLSRHLLNTAANGFIITGDFQGVELAVEHVLAIEEVVTATVQPLEQNISLTV